MIQLLIFYIIDYSSLTEIIYCIPPERVEKFVLKRKKCIVPPTPTNLEMFASLPLVGGP